MLANAWINDYRLTECSARTKLFVKSNFDYCFESSQINLARPDVEIYQYALHQMGFKPQEVSIQDRIVMYG